MSPPPAREHPSTESVARTPPPWVFVALVFVATLLAYSAALRAGFVWNDLDYVTRPDLRSLHGLWRIWFEVGSTEQHYPLLHSFFWLEHRLWGDAPLGYHLANVLLHATAACLFALCLRRLLTAPHVTHCVTNPATRPPPAPAAFPFPKIENRESKIENSSTIVPWLAAFLFALHPVCVESVAWISEQKNTLSLVFYLAAALAYLRFDTARTARAYRLATALFVLALLSKSLTATLPPALLVVFWWRRGRIEWRRDVAPLLPWFLLGALFGLFSAWVERSFLGTVGPEFALSFVQRGLVAGRAILFYFGKLLWPADLVFIYPRWTINPADFAQWLYPAGTLLLGGALWLVRNRWRGPLAAFLFFTGSLFPVMGFFNLYAFRYAYVADHWQYLPSLGVIAAAAFAIARLARELSLSHRALAGTLVIGLVLGLGVLSWRETRPYRDLETFYRTIIARNPSCRLAYINLGSLLLKNLDLRAVTTHFHVVRRPTINVSGAASWQLEPIAPTDAPTDAATATPPALPPEARRVADAIDFYQQALVVDPESPEAFCNLGYFLTQLGQLDAGIRYLENALRLKPDFAEALLNVGNAYVAQSRVNDGIHALRHALQVQPGFDAAGDSLGNALLRADRVDDAIRQYTDTLRLHPDYFDARINLGNALARADRLTEAIAEYEIALRQEPSRAEGHNNLGFLLLRLGRVDEAIAHFERALTLWPDYATARNNLELARREAQKSAP